MMHKLNFNTLCYLEVNWLKSEESYSVLDPISYFQLNILFDSEMNHIIEDKCFVNV